MELLEVYPLHEYEFTLEEEAQVRLFKEQAYIRNVDATGYLCFLF